jgi:hypothetical protein
MDGLVYNGSVAEDVAGWTIRDLGRWMNDAERAEVDEWGAWSQRVSRVDLDEAMGCMEREGYAELPFARMCIKRPQDAQDAERAIRELLDAVVETYQMACEAWFPSTCAHFLYGGGPFRFVAYVDPTGITYWREPVDAWGSACVVTSVPSAQMAPSFEEVLRRVDATATSLGRAWSGTYASSSRLLRDWSSPVSREVRGMLNEDLRKLADVLGAAT